jgi:hypothetical protein
MVRPAEPSEIPRIPKLRGVAVVLTDMVDKLGRRDLAFDQAERA